MNLEKRIKNINLMMRIIGIVYSVGSLVTMIVFAFFGKEHGSDVIEICILFGLALAPILLLLKSIRDDYKDEINARKLKEELANDI